MTDDARTFWSAAEIDRIAVEEGLRDPALADSRFVTSGIHCYPAMSRAALVEGLRMLYSAPDDPGEFRRKG
jgi:hypothetical protein